MLKWNWKYLQYILFILVFFIACYISYSYDQRLLNEVNRLKEEIRILKLEHIEKMDKKNKLKRNIIENSYIPDHKHTEHKIELGF